MSAFEVVVVVVSVIAIVTSVLTYVQFRRGVARLGRQGLDWFDRKEDLPIEQQPSEDERDDPIPKRPLRGRSD